MTEKLFRPLHVGSVPVYKGSPLALDFMPDNHSIIMVDDFESPKLLAEFLLELNENDEKYEVTFTAFCDHHSIKSMHITLTSS